MVAGSWHGNERKIRIAFYHASLTLAGAKSFAHRPTWITDLKIMISGYPKSDVAVEQTMIRQQDSRLITRLENKRFAIASLMLKISYPMDKRLDERYT
jgi:hypothetical protein